MCFYILLPLFSVSRCDIQSWEEEWENSGGSIKRLLFSLWQQKEVMKQTLREETQTFLMVNGFLPFFKSRSVDQADGLLSVCGHKHCVVQTVSPLTSFLLFSCFFTILIFLSKLPGATGEVKCHHCSSSIQIIIKMLYFTCLHHFEGVCNLYRK